MIKINLYAGPGAGKSTVSGILYGIMKTNHLSCELVREYAKDLVYEGLDLRISDDRLQTIIFAEQLKREMIIEKGQVQYLITDSPLLLNAYYSKLNYIKDMATSYAGDKDFHFWIDRFEESFETNGRSHNEEQSLEIDKELKKFLIDQCGVSLIELNGTSKEKAKKIFKLIEKVI